jgi:hypothetical protein
MHLYRNAIFSDHWTACGIEIQFEKGQIVGEEKATIVNLPSLEYELEDLSILQITCEKCKQSEEYKKHIADFMAKKLLK